LDSGDVLISEEHRELSEKIEGILLPVEYRVGNVSAEDTGKMERWRRRVNDLQHLMAHVMAGNNAFVTSDNGMLKRRDRLRREAGIVVVDPDEAVRLVRSEGADLASQA
jgi:hypothetical protein